MRVVPLGGSVSQAGQRAEEWAALRQSRPSEVRVGGVSQPAEEGCVDRKEPAWPSLPWPGPRAHLDVWCFCKGPAGAGGPGPGARAMGKNAGTSKGLLHSRPVWKILFD